MTIFEDLMADNRSHSRECWKQQRCICGHDERQNADFEAQLKRAMEKHPEPTRQQYDHAEHKRFMRGL